jgi:N-acetylglutamate synthase-like GNAT family acetyltransferase
MQIRPYKSEDRESCLELFKSNIPKFFLQSEMADFEEFLAKYTKDVYWVLEDSGKILASGGIGVRNGEGRLHYGIVANDWHRKGLGSRLVRFRSAKLIENPDVVAISLDTSQHNPEFFNRFGFVETSAKENAYGPGLHRHDMRWVLPADIHERAILLKNLLEVQ